MAKDKIRMPSAQGGLVRYFDEEYKSRFIFAPQYVLAVAIAICVAIIALHVYGAF